MRYADGLPKVLALSVGLACGMEAIQLVVQSRTSSATDVVVGATAAEARVLGLRAGAPLVSIARTAWTVEGWPFERSHDLFRADRTRIVVRTEGGTARAVPSRARVVELHAQAAG